MPGVIEFVRHFRVAFVIALGLAGFSGYSAWREFRGAAEPLTEYEPPPAYETPPLPAGLDSLTSFEDAARQIEECVGDCSGIVYFWTRRMPLSRSGIAEISRAAQRLGMPLALVGTEDVYQYASAQYASADPGLRAGVTSTADAIPIADAMLGAGVLAHAPAVVVHEGGQVVGRAILGYKTAETYEGMIARRVSGTVGPPVDGTNALRASGMTSSEGNRFSALSSAASLPTALERGLPLVDYEAVGNPGAYFRWVPGRQALAYESRGRIYLLDLADGQSRRVPGNIDFVPTPDGRYFVTPGRRRSGLAFFDADEVFEAARADAPALASAFFTDPQMRDQYPSVGILEQDESRTVYRVLTSWYEGIIYRDYEVQADPGTRGPRVRPIGEPVIPCSDMSLSTPIMSQDGLEVAARDESTGTTKVFRILGAGRCREVLDLGIQTTKVAWHRRGRLLAFARPRARRRGGGVDESVRGIFLYDRDQERLTRLGDSDDASLFAFPDFVGDDSVVFLINGPRMSHLFRVVDGVR